MSTSKFNVADKATFTVAGIEFIKFPEANGKVPVVARNLPFTSKFGDNNNLNNSCFLEKLNEIYKKIADEIGEENICEFETDLRTLDGLRPYPGFKSKISIPTFDFYRDNVEIFDMYPVNNWWWLATPESAKPHDEPNWTVCVSPLGRINYFNGDYCNSGVRPFLIFESSLFVSDGKEE